MEETLPCHDLGEESCVVDQGIEDSKQGDPLDLRRRCVDGGEMVKNE